MNYGLQLYSVRDAAEKDFAAMLRQVAEMGYRMVEPAGFFGVKAEDVAAMLKEYGLTVSGTHTGVKVLTDDFAGTVAYHHIIGCDDLIIPGARHSTAAEVSVLVDQINHFQPMLEAEGIRLHYHNHSSEFLPNKDGQIVHDELAARTRVLFELDTFWAFNAGLSPIDLMEKYRDRMRFIHLKDGLRQNFSDPQSRAQGKSLGDGEAPVAQIRKKAIELGLGMVVESEGLEPTGPDEVRRCIEYLRRLDAVD